MKPTLYKYILNEIWPTFLAGLLVFVFIVMATKMLSITDLIVARGVSLFQVSKMVAYLLPDIIGFALPAASLIAVVLAFLRLSVDSEIIALKSSGISLYQMLPPVLVFACLGFVIALMISFLGVPWGNNSFKSLIFEIARSKADLGLKERTFCEPFDKVVFYVNRLSGKQRQMEDVFVVDRRDESVTNTIIAEKGMVLFHPTEKAIILHFQDGTIYISDNDHRSSRTIKFETYDLNIGLEDIMAALASRKKSPKEMTAGELVGQLKGLKRGEGKYYDMMIELLEKGSIPLAVFLMAVIGMPLGAQLQTRGRSAGIGVSLGIFLIYYLCLAGARSICETGLLPPEIGVWVPDLFLAASLFYLFRNVAKERPIDFFARFSRRLALARAG